MKIVRGITELGDLFADLKGCSLTIGNFDGVHLGHQALIRRAVSAKGEGKAVLLTFDPHPSRVLSPDRTVPRIFDFTDQAQQLDALGVDVTIVEKFTREFSRISATDFFNNWIGLLAPKRLTVGHDFCFGAGREGNQEFMQKHCKQRGIEFSVVSAEKINELTISSTQIRRYIESGEIVKANQLLGRQYYIRGQVVKGDQRGRTIGFPTANVEISLECHPPKGVYWGYCLIDGNRYLSVANLGHRPTFTEKKDLKLEVHLLDFEQDLYGQELCFEFFQHLREEQKFQSIDDLVNQIQYDVEMARNRQKSLETI